MNEFNESVSGIKSKLKALERQSEKNTTFEGKTTKTVEKFT